MKQTITVSGKKPAGGKSRPSALSPSARPKPPKPKPMRTESAVVRGPEGEERIVRRAGPSSLARFPLHLREAARAYVAAVEFLAGGGRGGEPAGPRGGGRSEGPQGALVDRAAQLRRIDAALEWGLRLRRSDGSAAVLSARELLRLVVLEERSVSAVLARCGAARSAARAKKLGSALERALSIVAREFGFA